MSLADYQRAFVRMSLAREPEDAELARLGDPARFRMYRSMIRSRLEGMALTAFRGATEVAGKPALLASFARFLADVGPESPYLRDVIADFGDFAERDPELTDRASCLADLLRFETAKWRSAYVLAPRPVVGQGGLGDFDFEAVPVPNPVLVCLSLGHAVHTSERAQVPTSLFLYRPAELDQVRWYAADPFFFAVVGRLLAVREPFIASVKRVVDDQGRELDQELVEQLASGVTLALTRRVLLGSEVAVPNA